MARRTSSSRRMILDQKEKLRRLLCVVHDMMLSSDALKGASCNVHMTNMFPTHGLEGADESSSSSNVALSVDECSFTKQCEEQAQTIVGGNNTLYVPVSGSDNKVLAVLKLTKESGFSNEDIEGAEGMARHIGIFVNRMIMD